jgi:hypothetical protein
MKKKEQKEITVTVINPERIEWAKEKVTEHYYKKYLEDMKKNIRDDKS